MYYSLGRLADAMDHLDRSQVLMTELGYVPQRLRVLDTLGLVHARLGHFAEARRLLGEARRGWEALGPTDAVLLGTCWTAQTLSDQGDHDEAVALLRTMLDASPEAESSQDRSMIEACLGAALLAAERTQEALPHLERAARDADDRDVELLASLVALGRGDAATVEALLDARGSHEECYPRMAAHLWLGRATGKREHYERAHELLEQLVQHAPEADHRDLAGRLPLYREIKAAWRDQG